MARKYPTDKAYEVSNVGEVLKSERAFRQDVDMRLDVLERGIATLGGDAGVLVARVIRVIETEIAPRAAEIEALLAGYRSGVPAAAVTESAERQFLTPDRRAAIVAEAIASSDVPALIAAAVAGLAPLGSPALTGAPTAPTPPIDSSSTRIATTAFVAAALAALIGDAPPGLGTFEDLANAIGNDPNFAASVLRFDDDQDLTDPQKAQAIKNLGLGGTIPVGVTAEWDGPVAPPKWLFKFGQNVGRVPYAALFEALTVTAAVATTNGSATVTVGRDLRDLGLEGCIVEGPANLSGMTISTVAAASIVLSGNANAGVSGTLRVLPHGRGDGTTTFGIPDDRDRARIARGNMGGSAASRVTQAISGIISARLGATGGDQRMQIHNHPIGAPTFDAGGVWNGASPAALGSRSATDNAGAGNSQNMPPVRVVNTIIYAGV